MAHRWSDDTDLDARTRFGAAGWDRWLPAVAAHMVAAVDAGLDPRPSFLANAPVWELDEVIAHPSPSVAPDRRRRLVAAAVGHDVVDGADLLLALDELGLVEVRADGLHLATVLPLPAERLALTTAEVELEDRRRWDDAFRPAIARLVDVLPQMRLLASIDELAEASGVDRLSVRAALEVLERHGLAALDVDPERVGGGTRFAVVIDLERLAAW